MNRRELVSKSGRLWSSRIEMLSFYIRLLISVSFLFKLKMEFYSSCKRIRVEFFKKEYYFLIYISFRISYFWLLLPVSYIERASMFTCPLPPCCYDLRFASNRGKELTAKRTVNKKTKTWF